MAQEITYKLGKYLDGIALHSLDIITLVGTMTKEEKAFYTNAFLTDETVPDYNPHIMCATSGVGNAGIDSHGIGYVIRLGMPESIFDIYQEKGRAGIYLNANAMDYKYVLCFLLEDLVYLYKRAMDCLHSI